MSPRATMTQPTSDTGKEQGAKRPRKRTKGSEVMTLITNNEWKWERDMKNDLPVKRESTSQYRGPRIKEEDWEEWDGFGDEISTQATTPLHKIPTQSQGGSTLSSFTSISGKSGYTIPNKSWREIVVEILVETTSEEKPTFSYQEIVDAIKLRYPVYQSGKQAKIAKLSPRSALYGKTRHPAIFDLYVDGKRHWGVDRNILYNVKREEGIGMEILQAQEKQDLSNPRLRKTRGRGSQADSYTGNVPNQSTHDAMECSIGLLQIGDTTIKQERRSKGKRTAQEDENHGHSGVEKKSAIQSAKVHRTTRSRTSNRSQRPTQRSSARLTRSDRGSIHTTESSPPAAPPPPPHPTPPPPASPTYSTMDMTQYVEYEYTAEDYEWMSKRQLKEDQEKAVAVITNLVAHKDDDDMDMDSDGYETAPES